MIRFSEENAGLHSMKKTELAAVSGETKQITSDVDYGDWCKSKTPSFLQE